MLKKILASISLALIGILVLVTVITANIKVNHNINYATPNQIVIQYGSSKTQLSQAQKEQVLSLIGDATKESSLSALFGGRLNKKPEIVANLSGTGTSVTKRSLSNPSTNNFYVIFEYENTQKLMDGKQEYKDMNGNACYYNKLYFSIVETETSTNVDVFIVSDENQNSSTVYYERKYVIDANYKQLHEYLVENGFNK